MMNQKMVIAIAAVSSVIVIGGLIFAWWCSLTKRLASEDDEAARDQIPTGLKLIKIVEQKSARILQIKAVKCRGIRCQSRRCREARSIRTAPLHQLLPPTAKV